MDRQMVYAGSIPLDTDLLNIQRNILFSIGALAETVLGPNGTVDGLACSPSTTPFGVTVGAGSYTALHVTDTLSFGSLPPDASLRMRTALLPSDTFLQLAPPADSDHAICWLIQASISEADAGPVALPYWNAANPSVPFTGPGNSGQQQATQRVLRVALGAKASAPELGAGVPPAADPGWVGLYQVTTYLNKPQIDASDIIAIPIAPRLRFPLPLLPPGFTQLATFDVTSLWRVPPAVRYARVRLVGGGGGGGGGDTGYSGGGGGSGGYAEMLVSVTPGDAIPITVGLGGNPGSPGATGQSGGASAFGSLVSATGGDGGGSANPDCHGGKPGTGTAGTLLLYGGYGGDGAMVGQVPAGNGGASAFGGGGRGSNQGGVPAYGQSKGSGGGGGYGTATAGGGGASGMVLVEF